MSDLDVSTKQPPASPEQVATDVDLSPPRGNPFPIVGIGASAGGLEAFGQLLAALPLDSGMAFVLVQHLDPQHESFLPRLLSSHSGMPVVAVEDGLHVEPNHVYVIPPNNSMELRDGKLHLATREPGLHLPIDIFFRSLASIQGSRAIGVVLSGNASDGSLGVRAIKAECGITFAQSEETARFGGMPRSAVATGAIDYILAPAEIARELGAIASHPFLIPSRPGDSRSETLPESNDGELRRIFAHLYGSTKVDFSRYKLNTIRRRIGRRMMVLRLESMAEYARHIEEHPSELRELYRDLLISVTSFFRDPESFEALSKLMLEVLTNRPQNKAPIRVWVPGCATGEEVYSLAICLCEVLQNNRLSASLQFFGTDISDAALDRARRGIYSPEIEESVPLERLGRFFTSVEGGYQINKDIRESCVFAHHDVAKDPPFSNLDLLSCRNLLIYLDQAAQRHVLPVFHYALRPAGLLMLGGAEDAGAASDLFTAIDRRHKIYRSNAVPPRLPIELVSPGPLLNNSLTDRAPVFGALDLQKSLERVIQSKYSPDGVLINSEFQILQFRGHTSPYLDPSPGQASLNLLRMAAEGLVLPLRRALQTAKKNNRIARENDIEFQTAGRLERIALEVTPIPAISNGEQYFLVVFVREKNSATAKTQDSALASLPVDEHVLTLQQELGDARDYLRSLTEQHEAHTEELQAASEEARSTNEELQSTNEELRTAKEELQSANEELTTVNDELQSRNAELNATNSDLKNLLSAITLPVLMVDSDLRVRRFNTPAGKLLNLHALDIGRPIGHLRGHIETPRLEQQVRNVIESLSPFSEELRDKDGSWYALNVRPYRTIDDRIAGAVITLQDIDPLKRGLRAAEDARDYAEGMIETVREPLVVLDADLRVQRVTRAFYDTFLGTREETEGHFLFDLGNGQWNHPRLRELIAAALSRSEPFHDFELTYDFPHIGNRTMRLNGRRISFPHTQQPMLLLSIEDVTERKEIAEARFQRLFEAKDGIAIVDVETQVVQEVNSFFLDLTGYGREEFVERRLVDAGKRLGLPELTDWSVAAGKSEIVRFENLTLKKRNHDTVLVDVIGYPFRVGARTVMQFNIRDVSPRIQALEALRNSEQRFRLLVESVHDYALFQLDCNGLIVSWNAGAERLLGWKEQEAIGQPGAIVFTPEDIEEGAPEFELETARLSGRAEDERWHMRKNGSRFFASGVLTQVCDENGQLLGFAKVMRDVTARMEQEEQLRTSLSAKDTLVREIHHRVKNNLQVIVSLLSMQSRHTKDAQVLSAFNEAESRLRAIARIHERLYASDDLTEVEFAEYLTGLANELVQLHAVGPDQIQLELDIADMVLHIERAIPLGLIANELILNSLKHGMDGHSGRLQVSLAYLPETVAWETGESLDAGWAQLRITDSGPGLPLGLDVTGAQSMGLRLVNLLVRQLRGRLKVNNSPGVSFSVTFPIEEVRNTPGETPQ